ncbi:MAG TPA: homoserine O-succinyltransferase [Acidobacteriota bacterium]|nr:homoserine O-succinyltransferase [Acidobacteriota bacterium]
MPLVAHSHLPTFDRLRARGQEVLSLDRALSQDIRELHIGMLNMMPDAALKVTEQQYMRLIGSSNQIAQFYVYPFSVSGLPRSSETEAYIDHHYATFAELRRTGLDALIISGANVTRPSLELEAFWEPLQDVIAWAAESVTSILCSCLATHALVKHLHQIDRHRLPRKRWGVYSHQVQDRHHPLMQDINTRFDVPHSRWNEVWREDLEAAGLKCLVQSDVAGVHMAASPDQFRIIYMQGHPEYDSNSLLKEYKREAVRFLDDEIDRPPPFPEHYFNEAAADIAESYLRDALQAKSDGNPVPDFPEENLVPHLDNTWTDTGKAIFNNWLGLVYQYTNHDRRQPFAAGVDPEDPLGLRSCSD